MPTGVYIRTEKNLVGIRNFNRSKIGKKRPPRSKKWIENLKKSRKKNPIRNWKGGITKDLKKYRNYQYSQLSEEKRKQVSWTKNKRNRALNRLRKNSPCHNYGEWELLKKQYNYTCPCCHEKEPKIKLSEDHIIPLSRGGSDLIENIQPLCLSCNFKKHTLIIKY